MAKKVVQVPVDSELLAALDRVSRRQQTARSDLIRRACQRYIEEIEREEMDRRYQQGYETLPEEPEEGEAQGAMAGEVLPKESW